MMSNQRTVYFDVLRILASFAIIVVHVSAQNWDSTDIISFEWKVFTVFNGVARWGVPVFVMISGALFLERDLSYGVIFRKYILHRLIAYLVWSCVYVLEACAKNQNVDIIYQILTGRTHMWFLPMIMGLYLTIPFMRLIVQKEKLTAAFLIIAFVTAISVPQFLSTARLISGSSIIKALERIKNSTNLSFFGGFSVYFILGNYLRRRDIAWWLICIAGIIGFTVTPFGTLWLSRCLGTQNEAFYSNFSVNVFLESVFVFAIVKKLMEQIEISERIKQLVAFFSKCSFGAYLVHILVIDLLRDVAGLNSLTYSPVLSVIVISSLVIVLSYTVSIVLNRIPLIGRYIV